MARGDDVPVNIAIIHNLCGCAEFKMITAFKNQPVATPYNWPVHFLHKLLMHVLLHTLVYINVRPSLKGIHT